MNLSCQNINLLNNQASVFPPIFNPSDTKGFGTTSDTKGGGVEPTFLLFRNSFDLKREIFVTYRFILESLKKGKVDQISFGLSPW